MKGVSAGIPIFSFIKGDEGTDVSKSIVRTEGVMVFSTEKGKAPCETTAETCVDSPTPFVVREMLRVPLMYGSPSMYQLMCSSSTAVPNASRVSFVGVKGSGNFGFEVMEMFTPCGMPCAATKNGIHANTHVLIRRRGNDCIIEAVYRHSWKTYSGAMRLVRCRE